MYFQTPPGQSITFSNRLSLRGRGHIEWHLEVGLAIRSACDKVPTQGMFDNRKALGRQCSWPPRSL